MFCKQCGRELTEGQAVCTACGFAVGKGNHFCGQCGQAVQEGQSFCTACGFALNGNTNTFTYSADKDVKSKLVAGLLGIFLGGLGVHNFYLGFNKRGLIQLLVSVLTCGTFAIFMEVWGLVEGIFYLMGKEGYTTDADGKTLGE